MNKLADVLAQANEEMLKQMTAFPGTCVVTTNMEEIPQPPIPWDINNGWCEEWALFVTERFPKAKMYWIDELTPHSDPYWDGEDFDGPSHCIVYYRGKYYDAECHAGVKTWRELPIERNKGQARPS